MPLARIITRSPQDVAPGSEYLRSQGYTVETVSPGEFRVTPAELELDLDKCPPAKVLERTKALLEARQNKVPMPQLADQPRPEKRKIPIAYDIAGRPVEFADEEEPLPERRQKPSSAAGALLSIISRSKNWIAGGLADACHSLKSSLEKFQKNRAEQRALKLEAELAQEREEIRYEEERARARIDQEVERERQEGEAAERRRLEQLEAQKIVEERRRIATEQSEAEKRERERIEAERTAALAADGEKGSAEAEHHAAAERERIAAEQARMAARQENVTDTGREPESSSARDSAPLPLQVVPPKKSPAASRPTVATPLRRSSRRTRSYSLPRLGGPISISRKAVAVGFGASFVLLLGFIAYANRRPASPLSPAGLMNNQSIKQDMPFGAATIPGAPAVARPPAPANLQRRSRTSSARTSPAIHSSVRKAVPDRAGRRLRQSSQDDSVAEDEVVVRHLQPQRAKPRSTSSTAKLKQYSDMD